MKMLFFSDLHCHNWSQFHTRLDDGTNSRLNDCLSIIRQAQEAVAANNVQVVFFLGDLFESRKSLDIDVFTKTFEEWVALCSRCQVYMLVGNHDQHTKIGNVHSMSPFRYIEHCEVISDPVVISWGRGKTRIAAYPHMPVSSLKQEFSKLSEDPVDLVLLHQSIREGTIGPYARTIAAELSLTDLPLDHCRYVLAGDYHKRQRFGPEDRVHYIGSPLQLKADEIGEEKGFTIIDTADWEIQTVPTVYPKFHLFSAPEEAAAAVTAGEADPDKDFIRVKYTSDTQRSAEEFKQNFPRIQIDEETETRSLARTSADITDSDFVLCQEYADQKNDSLPEDRLMTIAMELLEGE